jgi:rRNA maturation RNase YbeY
MKQMTKRVAEGELQNIRSFVLSVIALSDEELLEINTTSLGHDWYTDVITFEIERTLDTLESEVYISVDRAKANAHTAKITLEREIVHLVAHAVLHLAGFDDHEAHAKKRMKSRERFYLAALSQS